MFHHSLVTYFQTEWSTTGERVLGVTSIVYNMCSMLAIEIDFILLCSFQYLFNDKTEQEGFSMPVYWFKMYDTLFIILIVCVCVWFSCMFVCMWVHVIIIVVVIIIIISCATFLSSFPFSFSPHLNSFSFILSLSHTKQTCTHTHMYLYRCKQECAYTQLACA